MISSDLANMVYASLNDTSSISAIKANTIYNTLSIKSLKSTKGKDITYLSYIYNGEMKYLFVGDIKLIYERSDGTFITEKACKIGFISSSSTIDNELNAIVSELTSSFVKINSLFVFICLSFVLIVTIISSRYLADFIMDDIIKLWIMIKLTQISQAKLVSKHKKNQKIEFTQKYYDVGSRIHPYNKNEIDILYSEIENILKVLNLQNFELTEKNNIEYNKSAYHEYTQILKMYKLYLKKIENNRDITEKNRSLMNYVIVNTMK